MNESVIVVANAVNMRILNCSQDLQLQLYELLSYFVDGYEQSDAFKKKRWNGRESFFTTKTQSCPAGFLRVILGHLTKMGVRYELRRIEAPEPLGPPLEACQARTGFARDDRYDYQWITVERLIKMNQMIAMLATGAGKSVAAALAFMRIKRPTLFITTRKALAYQMRDTLIGMGELEVGIIGDSEWMPNMNGFTVAMSQSLAPKLVDFDIEAEAKKVKFEPVLDDQGKPKRDNNTGRAMMKRTQKYDEAVKGGKAALERFSLALDAYLKQEFEKAKRVREDTIKLLERFEFVILEEAHESSAEGYYRVMKHCRNAHYRLALTATPFVRESEEANMRLMACSGPIGIRVTEKVLIDRGVLAKPYFKFIDDVPIPRDLRRAQAWAGAYASGIVNNDERNRRIVQEAIKGVNADIPVLALVVRKAHGDILNKLFSDAGIRSQFIYGNSDVDTRKRALASLASGKLQVLIGSNILDVGVDCPAIGMLILCGAGKAEVSHRQRIGRALRAKREGDNVAFVVDFIDRGNKHLVAHSASRKAIVESIEGFNENILRKGQEFTLPTNVRVKLPSKAA